MTMSLNMSCTSRIAGRFSASWHLPCVSWESPAPESSVRRDAAGFLRPERENSEGDVVRDGLASRATSARPEARIAKISTKKIVRRMPAVGTSDVRGP